MEQVVKQSPLQGMTIVLVALSAAAPPVAAQYARAYSNLPVDSNLLYAPITTVRADSYANADQPSNLNTRFNNATLIYDRTLAGFTGNSVGLGVILPYTSILGYDPITGQVTQNQSGFGDPSFSVDYNFFGAKAMSVEEFARTPPETYGGLHGVFTVPWGSYDSKQAKNIGSNQYQLKLTYNYTPIWNNGATQFDNYFSGQVFSDNNDYLGTNKLSRNVLWGYQGYLSHNLSKAVWVSVGAIGQWGGAVQVNGTQVASSQNNWQGQLGFGTKTWEGGSIIGTFNNTIFRQGGDPKIQSFMIEFLQIF